jgi:hypothetical protein
VRFTNEEEERTRMDIKQYGPALFPSAKQVRRMLDEDSIRTTHTRRENADDSASNPFEDSRAGVGK